MDSEGEDKMGIIELRHGDMFDGPSDLIVIPCSTIGTITPFVREKLVHHGITLRPEHDLYLGELRIHPFTGGENIAQFVGFAASVEIAESSEKAVQEIGRQIGERANEQGSISRIAVPLLGTGAGGLPVRAAIEALTEGFRRASRNDAVLVVSVLDASIFYRLKEGFDANPLRRAQSYRAHPYPASKGVASAAAEPPPRVFISYSHGSPEHNDWVRSLGTFLRSNGIDARLDVWHLRRGMDLPQFMTNEITLANRVIIISDETYAEKANGRLGGVGWETMIVQGDIYRLAPQSTKYIVVVRSDEIDSGTPTFLKTKFMVHWPGEITSSQNRDILLKEIFDVVDVPPIGARPTFI